MNLVGYSDVAVVVLGYEVTGGDGTDRGRASWEMETDTKQGREEKKKTNRDGCQAVISRGRF